MKKSIIFTFILLFLFSLSSLSAQVIPLRKTEKGTLDSKRTLFIQAARAYIGVPYVSGGTTKEGLDCSGLIYRSALDALNLEIPRTVASLSGRVQHISDLARESGDLVFFNTTGRVSHVGIYLGSGTFIHAASDGPRTGVIISDLSENYWKKAYVYAGRILVQEGLKIPDETDTNAQTVNPFPFTGDIGLRFNYTGGILWDFMFNEFPIRGSYLSAEASWVKNMSVYPGIGAGFSWDERTRSFSIPLIASLGTEEGYRFFIGTQIHLTAESSLDSSLQFPALVGCSWNSKPTDVMGQKVRFYQSIEYSWFPNETFGTGLRFNTGVTISCDI